MKNTILSIATMLLICLCGCSNSQTPTEDEVTDATMPDIVFIYVDYYWDTDGLLVNFFDNEGNYYTKEYDTYTSIDTILEEFKESPEDFSKLEQTCDIDELQSNYNIVYALTKSDDYSLVYPDSYPDVEADNESWLGVYYDDDGKLCFLCIHQNEYLTDIYANDYRANDVYAWYRKAIQLE